MTVKKERVLILAGVSCESPFETAGFTTIITKAAQDVALEALDSFDLVCFSGGTDIDTKLYGEEPLLYTQSPHKSRDIAETAIWKYCQQVGIPTIGICRGLQLITALTGGKLVQDVTNHAGNNHPLKILSNFPGFAKDQIIRVNSCHHQMCLPKDGEVLAVSHNHKSTRYSIGSGDPSFTVDQEVEAVIWRDKKTGGVQWHPEWMNPISDGHMFFVNMINELLGN